MTLPLFGAAWFGRFVRRENHSQGAGLVAYLALAELVTLVIMVKGRDPDVPMGRHVIGTLIALAAVALPVAILYTIGHELKPRTAVVVCAVLVIPLVVYSIVALVIVADYSFCPPEQYECPL